LTQSFHLIQLGTPTVLPAVVVPLMLITPRRAWLEIFDMHKIIARWILPLWHVASVPGVIVCLLGISKTARNKIIAASARR
jgi:uncharacterized membrane protein YozB (DUF420 family)